VVDDLFEVSSDGTFLVRVHVQPGAGRTAVVGRHGDALKLKVGAPPEQGRANEACAALLAEILGIKPADVALSSGGSSRTKRFTVSGIEQDDLIQRLELALADAPLGGGNARTNRGIPRARRR
jgi:uncharacterized protein